MPLSRKLIHAHRKGLEICHTCQHHAHELSEVSPSHPQWVPGSRHEPPSAVQDQGEARRKRQMEEVAGDRDRQTETEYYFYPLINRNHILTYPAWRSSGNKIN